MKVRSGFVSNSSSSSFVILKEHLDDYQIDFIKEHTRIGKMLGMDNTDDGWYIYEHDDSITGDTNMDNFDMREYLEKIDVRTDKVSWDD